MKVCGRLVVVMCFCYRLHTDDKTPRAPHKWSSQGRLGTGHGRHHWSCDLDNEQKVPRNVCEEGHSWPDSTDKTIYPGFHSHYPAKRLAGHIVMWDVRDPAGMASVQFFLIGTDSSRSTVFHPD